MNFEVNLSFFNAIVLFPNKKDNSHFLTIPKSHKLNRKDFSVSLKKIFSDV